MDILIGRFETEEELEAAKLWIQHWSPLTSECYGGILKAVKEKKEFDPNGKANMYCRFSYERCYVCARIFSLSLNMSACPCLVHGPLKVRDLVGELIKLGVTNP